MTPIPLTEQIEVAESTARFREWCVFKFEDTYQATMMGGPETLLELKRTAEVTRAIVDTLKGAVG
jgi:hypothetical protein